jgi:hypothetical protein
MVEISKTSHSGNYPAISVAKWFDQVVAHIHEFRHMDLMENDVIILFKKKI